MFEYIFTYEIKRLEHQQMIGKEKDMENQTQKINGKRNSGFPAIRHSRERYQEDQDSAYAPVEKPRNEENSQGIRSQFSGSLSAKQNARMVRIIIPEPNRGNFVNPQNVTLFSPWRFREQLQSIQAGDMIQRSTRSVRHDMNS
jgi:hypothetical protein